MSKLRLGLVLVLALAAFAGAASASAPSAGPAVADVLQARPAWTKNCTALNSRFPHGVGRRGARDSTSGDPVTNFRRSNLLYRTAMRWNRGLDRDKDGIACEKR